MAEIDSLQSLIFRLMNKADSIDTIIRELSVELECNSKDIEANRKSIDDVCRALRGSFEDDAVGIPVNRKEAVKLFKGMTGRQKFILLCVWGAVAGLGLIAFILNKISII